jgi:rsbT antagonist protein RsbS
VRDLAPAARIPIQLVRGHIVVSIQVELGEEILERFRADLLDFVRDHSATGVLVDLSAVEIIDPVDFSNLRKILGMAQLMGARPLLTGLRPGVVSALVQLGAATDGLEASRNLDDGFELLDRAGGGPAGGDDGVEASGRARA